MSYRKIMEKMAISSRKWLSIDRLGLEQNETVEFAEFVRKESGGLFEVLYDRNPETGEIYAMIVMRMKSVPEGDIRRMLGIDRFTMAFLLYVLFEEIQGHTYVPAEDIIHMLKERGISKENLMLKKFIAKLEDYGLIQVRDDDTDFIFIRPTALLRRLIDTSKVAANMKDVWQNATEEDVKKIIGRDDNEAPITEN